MVSVTPGPGTAQETCNSAAGKSPGFEYHTTGVESWFCPLVALWLWARSLTSSLGLRFFNGKVGVTVKTISWAVVRFPNLKLIQEFITVTYCC